MKNCAPENVRNGTSVRMVGSNRDLVRPLTLTGRANRAGRAIIKVDKLTNAMVRTVQGKPTCNMSCSKIRVYIIPPSQVNIRTFKLSEY